MAIQTISAGGDEAQLILPRQEIGFVAQPGTLVRMYCSVKLPDILATPWLREDAVPLVNSTRFHNGYVSGGRSGLFPVGDAVYKLKGCKPEPGEHKGEPGGMQAIPRAEVELERTHRLRTIMRKERLEAPYAPIGYYRDTVPEAATGIMKALGDTRLDQFMAWLEENGPDSVLLEDVFYRLGCNAGAGLRLFHESGMIWNGQYGNAHPGNAVVYVSKGRVLVAPVDLDDAELGAGVYSERQDDEYQRFAQGIKTPEVISAGIERIDLRRWGQDYPVRYRQAAVRGFERGYKSGSMTPLTLSDLRRAKAGATTAQIRITRYRVDAHG